MDKGDRVADGVQLEEQDVADGTGDEETDGGGEEEEEGVQSERKVNRSDADQATILCLAADAGDPPVTAPGNQVRAPTRRHFWWGPRGVWGGGEVAEKDDKGNKGGTGPSPGLGFFGRRDFAVITPCMVAEDGEIVRRNKRYLSIVKDCEGNNTIRSGGGRLMIQGNVLGSSLEGSKWDG